MGMLDGMLTLLPAAKFGFIGQQELFAVANAISRCIL